MDRACFCRWVVFRGVPAINNVIIDAVRKRPLGNCRGTGEIAPFCTCGSLMAQWTYAFGAHVGLSPASWCLPSNVLHPKLRKVDAVLITLKLIALPCGAQ